MLEGASLAEMPSRGNLILTVPEIGGGVSLGAKAMSIAGIREATVLEGRSSKAAATVSSIPSASWPGRTRFSASERLKGVVVEDYESDSDIDPKDMRMLEEGFTRVVIFLKMDEKYRLYRNMCCEMHEQLRAGSSTQSVRDELEKRDE